jgi:inositol oxygenase
MFRDYSNNKEENKIKIIRETYKNQREKINYSFNNYLINKYCIFNQKDNFWSLFHKLDNIVDLSDPDTSFPNSIHALQTAEAIRKDNLDDWLVLCGLLHDFGKIIYLKGEDNDGTSINTQWSIVGDTFITGCRIPNNIVLSEFNIYNKDHMENNNYYKNNTGLDNCSISFGHDEYMYRLIKANNHKMPREAEYIIRYHSLYAWHLSESYDYLQNEEDVKMKDIVKLFNKYDLYTKNHKIIEWNEELKKYYTDLFKKYFNEEIEIKY